MKFLRLILVVVLMGAVMGLTQNIGVEPLVGSVFVGFAFWLNWDFLSPVRNPSAGRKFRKFLFFVGVVFAFVLAFVASFQELFGEYAEYFSSTPVERVLICGSMPGAVATLWLATIVDSNQMKRGVAPFVMVGGMIVGTIVGFVISLLSALGPVILIAIMVGVSVVAMVFWFKFIKANGPMFSNDGPQASYGSSSGRSSSRTSSSGRSYGGSSSYSSSYGSTSSVYSEGESQLDYYMDDVASDNCRSRNLPYDCSIRSDVSFSHYGDDAYFTVDFTIDTSCCSAETQHQYDMMIRDAQSFQKEVMNDLFNEGKRVINRLKQKYPDFRGVNFEVKVGDINEY